MSPNRCGAVCTGGGWRERGCQRPVSVVGGDCHLHKGWPKVPRPMSDRTAPDPVAALRLQLTGIVAPYVTRQETARDIADALLAQLAPLVQARERVEALADLGVREQWPPDEWRAALYALTPTEERP